MQRGMRTAVAAGFLIAVVSAAAAFGEVGSEPTRVAPVVQASPEGEAGPEARGPRHRGRFHHRMVHGEMKVQKGDGFALVITDVGTVTAVDGATITIERADGEQVTVTATEDTAVRRNGERAEVSDVQVGDLARFVQIEEGDERVLRLVGARSPDWEPERRPRHRRPLAPPPAGEDLPAFGA